MKLSRTKLVKVPALTTLLVAVGAVCTAAGQARAADAVMTGKFYEKIAPTNPIFALIQPGIGKSPSPKGKTNEVIRALDEFADPQAAKTRLEAIKKKHGFSGGKVFAIFGNDSEHTPNNVLEFICGVSSSESNDDEKIRDQLVEVNGGYFPIEFRQFKMASPMERVRAIARCLSGLPGMPALKTSAAPVRNIYIDQTSYELAEKWLKSKEPKDTVPGTAKQYRAAFDCIVADAARHIPDAVSESVVFRSITTTETRETHRNVTGLGAIILPEGYQDTIDYEDYKTMTVYLSVLNDKAAKAIWKEDHNAQIVGLWPTLSEAQGYPYYGTDDLLEKILGKFARESISGCRNLGGLVPVPLARLPEPAPSRTDKLPDSVQRATAAAR